MLREGAKRLQGQLQQRLADPAVAEVVASSLTAPKAYGATFFRLVHSSSAPAVVPRLPLHPQTFSKALGQSSNSWSLLSLWRRAFSSHHQPKRGFENFFPRTHGKDPKSKAPKVSRGPGSNPGGKKDPKGDKDPSQVDLSASFNYLWLAIGAYFIYSLNAGSSGMNQRSHEISFQDFKTKLLAKGVVSRLEVANNSIVKVFVKPDGALLPQGDVASSEVSTRPLGGQPGGSGAVMRYYFQIGSVESFERNLDQAQRELGIPSQAMLSVKYVHEVSLLAGLMELLPTLLLLGGTYWLISRQMGQMMGGGRGVRPGQKSGMGGMGGQGGFFGMVKANTGTLDKAAKEKIYFKDVAGCDEAKREIMEFVDFLKKPAKYNNLGAKIPKGALLVGPPGTGKTLLAKATAGEADVPFLSISGSDFMEMFVGVGPARVRDLFAQARTQSPSIIFIDEIDAIGRARGRGGAMGGHDERENTLNQLLVEMDGFSTTTGVVVLAGTNRPDILDKALLRPGRFDRMITVDTPDVKGREHIFRVHLGKLKLAKAVEFYSERLAALTPGMAGADIANICNEAALVAARHDKTSVDMVDFEQAIDRVIGGAEKKNKVISPEERRTVAFHEAGHAVVSWFCEYAEPLLKVSIVPRGSSVLGFAQYLPNENLLLTKEQLLDRVMATLGGRAAEQVLLGKISTGAVNDLEKVTQMAYSQVAVYGMNDKIGLLSYRMDKDAFDKPYSDETARMIDDEVRAFVDDAYKRTLALVEKHKDRIIAMANELLRKEVIGLDDIDGLLGKRPFMNAEFRNIDRVRRGEAEDKLDAASGEAKLAASTDASSGSDGPDEGAGGKGEGPPPPRTPQSGEDVAKALRRRVEKGVIVAI